MAEHDPSTHVCVGIDSKGNRYTEHVVSTNDNDPWREATILSPHIINRLRAEGELPLSEPLVYAAVPENRENR